MTLKQIPASCCSRAEQDGGPACGGPRFLCRRANERSVPGGLGMTLDSKTASTDARSQPVKLVTGCYLLAGKPNIYNDQHHTCEVRSLESRTC